MAKNLGEFNVTELHKDCDECKKGWFFNHVKKGEWVRGVIEIEYHDKETLPVTKDGNIIRLGNKK